MQTDIKCEYCRKSFPAKRDTAKYCSNSCRTLANKQRRKNELLTEKWRKEKEYREAEEQRIKDERRKKRKQKADLKRKHEEELKSLDAVVPETTLLKESLQPEKESGEISPQRVEEKLRPKDTPKLQSGYKDWETIQKEIQEKKKKKQDLEKEKRDIQNWIAIIKAFSDFWDKYLKP